MKNSDLEQKNKMFNDVVKDMLEANVNIFRLRKDSINCKGGTIFTQPNKSIYISDHKCKDMYYAICSSGYPISVPAIKVEDNSEWFEFVRWGVGSED